MDRNLTERLKKLSIELADKTNAIEHHSGDYTEQALAQLQARIDDIQDEIWDVEDQLEAQAQDEYDDHSAKGWN